MIGVAGNRMTDDVDDLAAFLVHRIAHPGVTDAEPLETFAVVAGYQDGNEPPVIEATMRARTDAVLASGRGIFRCDSRPGRADRSGDAPMHRRGACPVERARLPQATELPAADCEVVVFENLKAAIGARRSYELRVVPRRPLPDLPLLHAFERDAPVEPFAAPSPYIAGWQHAVRHPVRRAPSSCWT